MGLTLDLRTLPNVQGDGSARLEAVNDPEGRDRALAIGGNLFYGKPEGWEAIAAKEG